MRERARHRFSQAGAAAWCGDRPRAAIALKAALRTKTSTAHSGVITLGSQRDERHCRGCKPKKGSPDQTGRRRLAKRVRYLGSDSRTCARSGLIPGWRRRARIRRCKRRTWTFTVRGFDRTCPGPERDRAAVRGCKPASDAALKKRSTLELAQREVVLLAVDVIGAEIHAAAAPSRRSPHLAVWSAASARRSKASQRTVARAEGSTT